MERYIVDIEGIIYEYTEGAYWVVGEKLPDESDIDAIARMKSMETDTEEEIEG